MTFPTLPSDPAFAVGMPPHSGRVLASSMPDRILLYDGITGRLIRPEFGSIFSTTFRSMPMANVEGLIESEGSTGSVSVGRAFRYLQIDTGPRCSPSACSEI